MNVKIQDMKSKGNLFSDSELKQCGHFIDILCNKEVLEINEAFIWASYVNKIAMKKIWSFVIFS